MYDSRSAHQQAKSSDWFAEGGLVTGVGAAHGVVGLVRHGRCPPAVGVLALARGLKV
jgi:hypothetical protein